jgi:inward rectifier potassium channel
MPIGYAGAMSPDPSDDPRDTPFPRVIRRNGDLGPIMLGRKRAPLSDLYHTVLSLPLSGVLGLMAAAFVATNLVFTGLYLLDPGGVANLRRGDVWNAFFFSVETFGTIGYGYYFPKDLAANLIMSVETFVGLVYVAMATGLVFARVSRPTARVTFSRVAVVSDFDGERMLMFRAANTRTNQILEAEVTLTLAQDGRTLEGHGIRRFTELKVVRARTPLFAYTWTVLHRIDQSSPLWGATAGSLADQGAELIVMLSGVDDRYAQRVHARHAYAADEIAWEKRLADILSVGPAGRRVIDYRRFHDVEDV